MNFSILVADPEANLMNWALKEQRRQVARQTPGAVQDRVTAALRQFTDPCYIATAGGLIGPHLLGRGSPAAVVYSFVLYERGPGANLQGQDVRIQTLLEEDAFRQIHRGWGRLGYPFSSLVPSYATTIGSSGDNPAALAELAGIILNDGIQYPSVRVEQLRFGEATPFETVLEYRPSKGVRVLSHEVVAVLQQELWGVVREGTGRRLALGLALGDGSGQAATNYTFTSALTVELLRRLGPALGATTAGRGGWRHPEQRRRTLT